MAIFSSENNNNQQICLLRIHFTTLFCDNTYYDRVWSKNCHEKKKEIRKDTKRLIKVALAPLPIYRTWTNKSEEKTLRLEKEIVMLRQLLDNAIPEDANSYLKLVSESLKEIEKVLISKLMIEKSIVTI